MANSNEELLLRKLGEETLHSAKGHFKACDLRRQLTTFTIWGCALVNIAGVAGLEGRIDQWISFIGLFGTIALLIWNEGEGKNYRAQHKASAENYLALHKEIRSTYILKLFNHGAIQSIQSKVILLDSKPKPDIPRLARWLAKRSIEGKDPETDNWFKDEH